MRNPIIAIFKESAAKHYAGKYLKLSAILLVAIVVRVACFLYYQAHSEIRVFESEKAAVSLIQGKGFMFVDLKTVYRAGVAPAYPALCAFIYLIFGHHQALIVLLQIALDAGTCALIFFIAESFFNRKCAYLAAILTALHPGLIIYSSTVLYSLSFYTFLLCSSFFLLIVALKNGGLRYKVLLGLSIGLCVLARSTFLPFFALGWLWLLYYSVDKKEAKRAILVSIVSLFLIITPWVVRNTLIFKRVIFQTSQWNAFWIGNNPQSSGSALMPSGKTWIDASPEEFRKKFYSLDEIGQMDLLKTEALTFVRQHPDQFAIRTLKKLYYFWWFSPQAGLLYPASYLILYKMYYSVILVGSFIGLIWALFVKETRPLAVLMLLLFSSNSLLHSLYYVEGRHRCSVEPFMLICFSFGVFQILRFKALSKDKLRADRYE